jgi:hypothetical protein
MPEWLAQQFCHRASVKHARMACTKFRQNILKHAEKYVKHGLHQISVKHTRKAAACTSSHGCTCFFPRCKRATRANPSFKSATPATQSAGGCRQAPRLPRKCDVHVAKCHACQSVAAPQATNGDQARHRSQHSVISAAPATQGAARCQHACDAKCR